MSEEEIKMLERRWIKKMNDGKASALAAIEEFFATDYVSYGTGGDLHGLKEFKQSIIDFFSAFPDVHFSIDDVIVEGDKVAVRFTFSGTHKGEVVGIPPSGEKWTMWGICIHRIVGGKIVESWERHDSLGLVYQFWRITTPEEKNQN